MQLDDLRRDCALKQKKGLPFIAASVAVWCGVLAVQLSGAPPLSKNLYTFCCTAMMGFLPFMLGKAMKADMRVSGDNPLGKLGLLFTVNQALYILIALWVYAAVPDKLVMVLAIIFGAHLMPFGWLYMSRAYTVFSVLVSVAGLGVGLAFAPYVLAAMMILVEAAFSICLWREVKAL